MSLALSVLVVMCSWALTRAQFTGQTFGQPFGFNNMRTSWGNQANIGWWNGALGANGVRTQRFLTGIGRNQYGDEIRITFKTEEPDPMNNWAFNWNRRDSLRFTAVVKSRSTLQGQFNFVVTRYGRVEDSCQSRALGEILPSNQWWNQNRVRGVIGSPITLMQGQISTSSESLDTLTLDELNGRGLALCQTTRLSGTTCFDLIHLCCKIGRDSSDVTLGYGIGQFMQGGQMGAGTMGGGISGGGGALMGGTGINNGGFNNGISFGGGAGATVGGLPIGADTNQPSTVVDAGTGGGIGTLTF